MIPAPTCLAPSPEIARPEAALPPGACDAHAHVIGPHARYPLVADRSYTPPESSEAAYLAMLTALGLARGVLVQPSIYGTDNRLMLAVLRAHPERLRGVAVVAPTIAAAELVAMHAAGVRGFRINLLFRGGVGLDALEATAAAIADRGWHAQLLIDLRSLPELAPRLAALPVPVVLDHLGHFPAELGTAWDGFETLLALAERRELWVKLSGFYRLAPEPGSCRVEPIARRLIAAMPDRLVWGSDWPHVGLTRDMPDTGRLLNTFLAWCPDQARRCAILVDNPAHLYGFDPA